MIAINQPIDAAQLALRVDALTASLSPGLGKVATRFVRDMLLGMGLAHSTRLTDISRALGEGIGPRATHKRLSRNVQRAELAPTVSSNLLRLAAGRVDQDSLVFLDWPNLRKQRARKMDSLKVITDTRGQPLGNGYHRALVTTSGITGNRLTPLAQTLWPEINGNADFLTQTLNLLALVRDATGNRGMLVADRSADHPGLLVPWTSDDTCRYLVRLRRHTRLMYGNRLLTVAELASMHDTPYGRNVLNVSPSDDLLTSMGLPRGATVWRDEHDKPLQFIHFGQMPVRLPDFPDRQLGLVLIHGTVQDPLALLTTEPTRDNRALLTELVESYLRHWRMKISTLHFHQTHNFSKVRVLRLHGIQNIAALTLALAYLHSQVQEDEGPHGRSVDSFGLIEAGISLYQQ